MIGILNYGLGNVHAIQNIYRRLGIDAQIVSTIDELGEATKIILPGVGAFDWAIERLQATNLLPTLNERVMRDKVPVLGICVGMQIMCKSSEEGEQAGLGWINATVRQFDKMSGDHDLKLPHMGWNSVMTASQNNLFKGIDEPLFYFLHSYYVDVEDPELVCAYSEYSHQFVSAINSKNIYATQFHPEKSHDWGIQLLKNFAEYC